MRVRETFGYQFLRSILPFAIVACLVSAVAVFFAFTEANILLPVYLLLLAGLYYWIRYDWFPKIETENQADLAALLAFCAAAIGNMMAAGTVEHDSVVSCAMKLLLASFVMARARSLCVYVVFAVGGQLLVRYLSGNEIDYRYQSLVILTPVYAVLSRQGISRLKERVSVAQSQLQSKIDELQREKTLREDTEKQLTHAQKMEGLGLLAAGVAHDFNNHLQTIGSLASLIQMGDKQHDYPSLIQDATQDAAEICRQMLAYAGKTQDVHSIFNVARAIEEIKPMLDVGVPKHILLRFDISEEALFVRANKTALQQCLTNLIRNSVESIAENKGQIELRIRHADQGETLDDGWRIFGEGQNADRPVGFQGNLFDSTIVLEVIDDGCGMTETTLECAFDPYFTTKVTGHGFGLATTLGIVRSLGGLIRCRSGIGQGTHIQIVLPESNESEPDSTSCDPIGRPKSIRRILLIDDEEPVRTALAVLLQRQGFEVTCANDAEEGLVIIRDEHISLDVLVLDYAMPNMTGMDFLAEIRSAGITIPVVLCSGFAKESIRSAGVQPNVFLNKPYRIDDLMRAFDSITSTEPN